MKKYSLFFIFIIFCLALSACGASDPEDLFGAGAPQSPEPEQADTAAPPSEMEQENTAAPPIAVEEGYYQYGNMQIDLPSGNYILYEGSVLFNRISDGQRLLYTYDMDTGEVSLVCKDATCSHRRADCPSNRVWGNLEQYDGRFYAEIEDHSGGIGAGLVRRVAEWKNGRFEQIIDGSVEAFWHANGNLYVETADQSLLVYENGSDTPRTLLDEYAERKNVVFGQYLYSSYGQGICRVDLLAETPQVEVLVEDASTAMVDGEYIYYPNMQDILYRCDLDGGNQIPLTNRPIYPGAINFDDDYVYFRYQNVGAPYGEEAGDLYRFGKDDPSQIEKIAEFPEAIHRIFTVPGHNLLFIEMYGQELDEHGNTMEGSVYTVEADGSGAIHLDIPES